MLTTTAFGYSAARSDGTIERGVVHASNVSAASSAVAGRGLFPIEVHVARALADNRGKIPLADLALGLRVLSDLLEAGLPMTRTLATFERLAPKSWHVGMQQVRDAIREGRTLATAFAMSPLGMPPLVIGIIRAGEAGSGLASAVRRSAELIESAATTRSTIRNALAYPIILACAGSISLALLVGIVLPRFAAILADLGQDLPATTRLVLHAGQVLRASTLPALLGLAVAALALRMWTSTEDGLRRWHGILLRLPVAGQVRFAAATARGAGALGSLLQSGVPITTALVHVSRATGDAAISARLLVVREMVVTGQRPSSAVESTCAMTDTAIQLLRAGEETGRLAPMLEHASRIEEARAARIVQSAVRLLEPVLILAFGVVVAFVAAALLQAVYSVRPH